MKSALASCAVLLAAAAGPAVGQETRPTFDKETGVIQLGNRATSRPFSFLGSDAQPAGFSIDLCLRVAGAIRESLKLPGLKVAWVTVTPAVRRPNSSKRSRPSRWATICGSPSSATTRSWSWR